MFLFNLSLAEFLALFAGVSGVVTALYLLDRTRQKHQVPTLRFWVHSDAPSQMRHRRRIQHPWSLLLQIVSLGLLLLALAQLRWGLRLDTTRDHVLILDASAIQEARTPEGVWMDQSRAASLRWLAAVPKGDRVMLVRADALPTAATAFESNHRIVAEAIRQTSPGASALRLEPALAFARQAQQAQNRSAGEIVYAGPGRPVEEDSGYAQSIPGLRILPVKGAFRNVGIRKIGVRRLPSDDGVWELYATVRNDSPVAQNVPVAMLFGGAPVAQRRLAVGPGTEQSVTVELRTAAAGVLETRLQINDDLTADNRATLELPARNSVRVIVYSAQPESLKPLFSHARFAPEYRTPAEYRPGVDAAMVVFDRFAPAPPTTAASLWIDPPASASPIPILGRRSNVDLTRWHEENPLGAGLRTRDLRLAEASIFAPDNEDLRVVEAMAGPVIVARPSKRLVVLGFQPMDSPLRFELATPLLFANILRWAAPEVFLRWELVAGAPGSVAVPLDADAVSSGMRVTADGVGPMPFSVEGQTLRFFSGAPAVVRVNDGRREMVYSLTLPEIAANTWKAPASAAIGVPSSLPGGSSVRDLWQWLAILGATGLMIEWLWFGRARRLFRSAPRPAQPEPLRRAS